MYYIGSKRPHFRGTYFALFFLLVICLRAETRRTRTKFKQISNKATLVTPKVCVPVEKAMKAKQKMCFLRPDSGPCRADIVQYYFDVKQKKCFRFYWGGCQGNGNRFGSEAECLQTCLIEKAEKHLRNVHFCTFPFDYGTCFGYFNRWTFDKTSGTCRTRVYSGCGGNQNNFHSKAECLITCMQIDNETMGLTTCVPFDLAKTSN